MDSHGEGIAVVQVRDLHGRSYRVGERPHDIMSRSRTWMLWLPWTAMACLSVLQYGYGVAAVALRRTDEGPGVFWVLALWVVCQAGVAAATAALRHRVGFGPSRAMLIGAVLCAAGPLTVATTNSFGIAVLGYSLLGGAGGGIVYGTCVSVVAKWYPERRASRVGLVSGAFGYGSVPFIAVFAAVLAPQNRGPVFTAVGICILVVVALCGLFFRDPPPGWWPAEVDPKMWAVDKRLNRSLLSNAPAIRQYWPSETVRTQTFALVYLIVVLSSAAALLAIVYLPELAIDSGFGLALGAAAVALLAVVNGCGRSVASWLSDRFGRRRTLSLALVIEGCGLVGLALSASAASPAGFMASAALSGLAGGAFYSLLLGMVADYFGERSAVGNYGLVYGAKLFGGVLGVGLPASLVPAQRLEMAFIAAGLLCLGAALLPRLLRRPGYPVCSIGF
ncbi:OFA family MFS transporter [Mycobacterium sp. 852002-51057_SCH5723018]|uniref:OFA family MFS transporter n=1 Tax=Mycobacterium sp. 852002-51057_SCH5723018 TaxID=1834094 RepID=UPI0007FC0131|nr:OFA family MFS transporter [Mycobacterium sp. 852002-51057_SCH5723018]OBG26460.1 transporter [Mycobacterium sp. 852002-51057_SCH5723018]